MSTLLGCMRLTRPVNALICGLSVIVAGSLGGPPLERLSIMFVNIGTHGLWNMPGWQWRTLLAALSATLILAAGNVFNDVRDLDCDRINAPYRPITSGQVPVTTATLFAGILAVAGIACSLPLGTAGITIACAATLLLAWYDIQLKRVPFAGNAAVALLGGLAFIYGGIAGNAVIPSLLPATFATLLHFSRELIKDGADIEGDSAARIKTAATTHGVLVTARIAALVLAVLSLLVLVPYMSGWFGRIYLTIIVFGNLPVFIYCLVWCLRNPSPERLSQLANILKAAMPMGLIAILAGFQWS